MGTYKEVEGDLIKLALDGQFDVIVHGCNCFCTMGAGLAPQMARNFNCDHFTLEVEQYKGDINKLGQIQFQRYIIKDGKAEATSKFKNDIIVVNAYTQYNPGKDLDYNALTLCLKKINHIFAGKHVGLPMIGAGIAGGVWGYIEMIIKDQLTDVDVTIVKYKPN